MISFIISAKNEEGYISDCLKSITLQKSEEPSEIIVVDNNSSDKTAQIAKQVCPQAVIIKEEKPGTSAARQRGSLEAKGEWLIFLDADVRLPDKNWLTRTLFKVRSSKGVSAVSSHYRYYDVSFFQKALQAIGTFGFIYPWLFFTNSLFHITANMIGGMMAIKKNALLQAGGFDAKAEFFGDEALIVRRLYKFGRIIVSPSLWVYASGRRWQNQGIIKTVFKYLLNYFWVVFRGKPYHRKGYKEAR